MSTMAKSDTIPLEDQSLSLCQVIDSTSALILTVTTKEKGTGIGLAVSRSIVEAHGGRLWAENNKTGGATFNVALPLTHTSRITLQAFDALAGSLDASKNM
jgi:signal transduction histidine kinase